MPTTGDIFCRNDTGLDEGVLQICEILLAGRRSGRVERDVSALRANDDLVASDNTGSDRFIKHATNNTFRTLASIVCRRIDEVDACFERRADSLRITRVICIVAFAEVGTDPDGGCDERAAERSKKVVSDPGGEPIAISRGAGWSGPMGLTRSGGSSSRHGGVTLPGCLLPSKSFPAGSSQIGATRLATAERHMYIEGSLLGREVRARAD